MYGMPKVETADSREGFSRGDRSSLQARPGTPSMWGVAREPEA
jgi:hypothetical protein